MAKFTTLVFVILFSISANAQSKADSLSIAKEKARQDSILYVSKILSMQDVDRIMMAKKDRISVANWELFWSIMNQMLLPEATQEFKSKQAAKKP
jgi:hypothetical protein